LQIFKEKKNVNKILEIFKSALSVTFDQSIGHSYFDNHLDRWEYYNRVENKIPYKIDYLNKITKGGVSRKTVTIIYGGVHAGKTAHMCSLTADNLLNGNNVLFISNEMSAEEIGLRIDVKLFDASFDDVKSMPKDFFSKKINILKGKTIGKLVIKQYPTATAHTGHFRILLDELKLKQNFVPDIIYIDYLNICASEKIRMGATINSYTYMKAVTEEIRALAIERDLAIYTATQINRAALSSSDIDMEDVSESLGIAMSADMIYALSVSDELIAKNLILVKQLKNRYSDKNQNSKFFLNFDRTRMNFTDSDNPEAGIIEDAKNPIEDRKPFERPKRDFSKFNF
jgi:archaellum biogenesis ATPase FlaH